MFGRFVVKQGCAKQSHSNKTFFIVTWRHDIEHDDIQHNDTKHNDTQHNAIQLNDKKMQHAA